jgi:rhamnose utilization protein RhaD (predicted bifunctional aldolase and dehydrogenase)/NAD(P)-dependent dehydrogenase (short-subunit alcohol dehydrogenase family)
LGCASGYRRTTATEDVELQGHWEQACSRWDEYSQPGADGPKGRSRPARLTARRRERAPAPYGGPVVRSLWDDADAERAAGDLQQRVYSSRLLGRDPDLVLHGGGNTSVKSRRPTVFGEVVDVLFVKGSGADLADIDEAGFAALRLDHVARLAELDALSDTDMAEQLLVSALVAGGPAPSVEAILHAVLPQKFVDHTHADAVVTLTNTPAAEDLLVDLYGDEVIVVPYVMPGFQLARVCAERLREELRPGVIGMVLMNHGIFTWGTSAKESYESMIGLVGRAEELVAKHRSPLGTPARASWAPRRVARAELRGKVAAAFGGPVVMSSHADEQAAGYLAHPELARISQRGPVTPDHVLRTKPWPMLGRDVDTYAEAYRRYFEAHRHRAAVPLRSLDPAPRVILDGELGVCCVGATPRDAKVVEDIYRHTMKVVLDATAMGGYQPVPLADLFDVEYWDLEQAKLRRRGARPAFAGEIALVTGAASGIGRACVEALRAEGAAVVGLDVDPAVVTAFAGPEWLGIEADVTVEASVTDALERAVERFGGLDLLVLNAGIFPPGAPLAALPGDTWRRTMAVNLDANAFLLREAHPLLSLAPRGGRVVVVGSKNVPAPGPGVAGYSASKAALTQLARVAALEWGGDGIRVNVVHPNAVFDTGAWSEEMVADRAARYGLTVEEYRRNNVLGTEVTAADVARLCAALCGPAFAKTTGAQVPVDGGNDRVI